MKKIPRKIVQKRHRRRHTQATRASILKIMAPYSDMYTAVAILNTAKGGRGSTAKPVRAFLQYLVCYWDGTKKSVLMFCREIGYCRAWVTGATGMVVNAAIDDVLDKFKRAKHIRHARLQSLTHAKHA